MTVVAYRRLQDFDLRAIDLAVKQRYIPEGEITAREGTKEYVRSFHAHMQIRWMLMEYYRIMPAAVWAVPPQNDPEHYYKSCHVIIDREESGRPVLVSPAGFHLSITHGGKMVACALSTDTPVGLDVQPIGKIAPRVLEKLYTENEREYVGRDPERFTEIWTRKESFVKMTGTGITRDISVIDTLTGENTNGAVFTTKRIGKKYLTLCTEKAVDVVFDGR